MMRTVKAYLLLFLILSKNYKDYISEIAVDCDFGKKILEAP